jgi:hypothetical protein
VADTPDEQQPEEADATASPDDATDQPDDGPSDSDTDGESGAQEQREGARVINHIYGGVHSGSATFGISEGMSARPATGRLRPADVERALRYYVPPTAEGDQRAPFDAADLILAERRLVVLAGDEGTGRYASALALLRRRTAPDTVLRALSPASTFAELSQISYTAGHGYVIADRLGDGQAGSVQKFDVDRLSERLDKADAYLVITTDAHGVDRRGLAGRVVSWHPPEPVAVLEKCLAGMPELRLSDIERDRIWECVRGLRLPRDVVALAERLKDGVDNALAQLDHNLRAQASDWFKATEDWREVLAVAALSFLYAMPQRNFERLHHRLITIDQNEGAHPPSTGEGRDVGQNVWLRGPQQDSMIQRQLGEPLDGDGYGREWLVVFRSPELHEHMLGELYECGYSLWKPLRIWLDELSTMPDLGVRMRVALGVALLARTPTAAAEVELDFLDEWSCGYAFQRLTAAWTLAFMAGSDALAPAALRIALGWTRNRGERRAMTAAVALGGPLGIRYPSDAIKWLWHLSTRSQRIRVAAAHSLALLFCSAIDEPADALDLLRRLSKRLRYTLQAESPLAQERAALDTVLTVLSARHLDRDEPVVAVLLRELPASASIAGSLWAEVLRSAPHNGHAIDMLRRTLEALSDAPNLVRLLGGAVRENLSDADCELLHRNLAWQFRPFPGSPDQFREAVSALLGALIGAVR